MQFGRSKADGLSREGHRRSRKSAKRRPIVLGSECLEPRRLLAAASINQAPNFTVAEQAALSSQLVATISDPTATVSDYAASISWGDGTTTPGQVLGTTQTGVFSVVGSHAYSDERSDGGNDTVRVFVSKDGGAAVTVGESATVTDPPISGSGGFSFSAVEGTSPGSQLVAILTDPAPETTAPLPYTATIDWGDGSVTAGTVTYNPALSAFQVIGGADHTYSTFGTETIKVTLTHDNTPNVTVTDTAAVSDAAIVAQGGFTYTANEGASPTAQPVATFTDPGSIDPLADYSATIDWGDGNTTAGSISLTGNQFSVLGAHTYAEEGSGVIQVVIEHNGTASPAVTVTGAYNISDPAVHLTGLTLSTTEGAVVSGAAVATFTDPGGKEDVGDYSAQIDWGDGTVSPGIVSLNAVSSIYTVAGSHIFQSPGIQAIVVTVQHDVATNATVTATAQVADVPVVGTAAATFRAVEGTSSASQILATFTDPGVIEPVTGYGATIDWGDGTTSTSGTTTNSPTVSFNPGTQVFTVTDQHLYSEDGIFPITVTLSHDQATNVTVTGTASVSDPAVVAIGGATFTALEYRQTPTETLANFSDPGGGEAVSDYSASINWGDGTVTSGQIASNGINTNFSVSGSHVFTTFGTHTPTVTVFHDQAPSDTVQDTAVVSVPTIQLSALPATWREWTVPVELSPLATLSFTDTEMTATINWGDGTASAGAITPDMLGSSGTVRGSHTYTEAGNYTISITVNDGTQSTTLAIPTTVLRELLPMPDPDAATPNDYYVAEAYGDVLRREVDSEGLRFWASALDAGFPRSALASALVNSPEYLANFVIGPAYVRYLGRAADSNGLQFWVSQMQNGLTDAMLVAYFASSPEFFGNAGGTNTGYVTALYNNVLGRSPDADGETFWVNQLNAGVSRFSVALQFAASGENFTDVVINDYELLLGRAPNSFELNTSASALAQGTLTDEGLIANIVATDEYFALSQNE